MSETQPTARSLAGTSYDYWVRELEAEVARFVADDAPLGEVENVVLDFLRDAGEENGGLPAFLAEDDIIDHTDLSFQGAVLVQAIYRPFWEGSLYVDARFEDETVATVLAVDEGEDENREPRLVARATVDVCQLTVRDTDDLHALYESASRFEDRI